MGLKLKDGVLLVDGTSLANNTDCCCGGCCSFTLCGSETPSVLECGTLPEGLEVGGIVNIDGECYTYNGPIECVGGDPTPTYGDVFATCNECINMPGCSFPWCASGFPTELSVSVSGLAYDGSGMDCEQCSETNTTFIVPYLDCSGTVFFQASWYLDLGEFCTPGSGHPRISLNIACNPPYTQFGINLAISVGRTDDIPSIWTQTGGTTLISGTHDFTTPVSITLTGGNCGTGTALISL